MNAAIVGAGGAGLLHALSFRAHGVPVDHVFDPDEARARSLAELCGARVHASLASLADAGAACVSICSPPLVHVAQAARCAERARVVFVEKPVAVSLPDLARLEAVPRCVPVVQWRAGRAIRAVRRALEGGLLGASPTACVDMALHRDAAYYALGRGAATWGCGALLSVGIHALDALCFALDRPVVAVHGAHGPEEGGLAERTAGVIVAFAGGALATLRITFDGGGPDETRMTFCGAGVTASIAGGEVDPTARRVRWRTRDAATRARLEGIASSVDGWSGAPLLVPYLGQAIEALRAGRAPGEHEALPSVRSVAQAHLIALRALREG